MTEAIHIRAEGVYVRLDEEEIDHVVRTVLKDDLEMLLGRQQRNELFDPDGDPKIIDALRVVADFYGVQFDENNQPI